MALVMGPRRPGIGISSQMLENSTPEQKEALKQTLRDRLLKQIEGDGERDGLDGKPMNAAKIESTGESDFFTKQALSYAKGYVRGRETRGRGRGKLRGKKAVRKTRRGKKLNGRK